MGTMIPCALKTDMMNCWGTIVDLSLTGIQVKTYFSMEEWEPASVTFKINERFEFADLPGEVQWVRDTDDFHLVGIKFESGFSRERILYAMKQLIAAA